MNEVEYWLVNNPLRALIQRRLEAPRLSRLSTGKAEHVLEIGCGQGVGARIIYETFSPKSYVGIDLDPRMIQRATRKGGKLSNATFMEGDAANLEFEDRTFDMTVDFGIVHHIPNWRDALAEIHRTLRPKGEFLFEELCTETWRMGSGRLLRKVLDHPYEQMFSKKEFVDELRDLGFAVDTDEESRFGLFHFWGRAAKQS